MASEDNLSSQLWKKYDDGVMPPLFASAREIDSQVDYGDRPAGMSKETLMAKKATEADQTPLPGDSDKHPGHLGGLTKKIQAEGYDWSKPIELHNESTGEAVMRDGHHRQAVMLRDRPDEFMPIKNTYDGPPTTSEKQLDEHFFNDVARQHGLEEAKRQMPLKHYPWLEHLHNPK